MHDVARLAGVSISTVSALINGAPRVSLQRTERILSAMEALDYHPDQIARSLKVGGSQTIGVLVPDITNDFYPAVFRGIEDDARAASYSVLLCNSNESAERDRLRLNSLFARRVDGVILACSSGSNAYESLYRRFPLVLMDRIPQGITQGAVSTDNVQAGRMAAEYLVSLGHRWIALLAGDLKLVVHDHHRCSGGIRIENGRALTAQLLNAKAPLTAIIAGNRKLLLGVLHAAREKGTRIPGDLSAVAFDELEWSSYVDPPITAVVQPTDELGSRAFEVLRARISSPNVATDRGEVIRLRGELRAGGSTDKPARTG